MIKKRDLAERMRENERQRKDILIELENVSERMQMIELIFKYVLDSKSFLSASKETQKEILYFLKGEL